MTRRPSTFARPTGHRIRVWGDGAHRLAELLDAPYRHGGFTVDAGRGPDLDAAAQTARIPLITLPPRHDRRTTRR